MKRYVAMIVALTIGLASLSWVVSAIEESNPYYAGYMACQSKYKQEGDNTEYNNCIAKAKCVVDNPGEDPEYCECVGNGWIKLNTNVPFVGRCINKDSSTTTEGSTTSTAFTDLIGGISKMVVTAILIVSFMFIIIGWVQRASGNPKEGKDKLKKVAIWLAILGASGAILRLINPNFFT